jgi:uncharacterized oxidoreductase
MKLTGNTILITGGASGIGYELTKQLTALGNRILITGRDQAKMDRAKVAFPKLHTFRSDVSDPKAIAALYEQVTKQFPELNILINNAGIMREINVHDKGICSIAHFTGLLRHQGRSAFVHGVPSCATEKHQSEGL